jgi:hypothetical protein
MARLLGIDYRRMRDREIKPTPVAVVVISGREVALYSEEQFDKSKPHRVNL